MRQTTVWKPWNIDIQRDSTVTKFFSYFLSYFSFLVAAVSVGLARDGRGRRCRSRTSFGSVEGRKRAQQRKRKRETLPVNKLSPCFSGGGGDSGWRKWRERERENEEDKPLDNNTNREKKEEEESVEMCVAVARLSIDR